MSRSCFLRVECGGRLSLWRCTRYLLDVIERCKLSTRAIVDKKRVTAALVDLCRYGFNRWSSTIRAVRRTQKHLTCILRAPWCNGFANVTQTH